MKRMLRECAILVAMVLLTVGNTLLVLGGGDGGALSWAAVILGIFFNSSALFFAFGAGVEITRRKS